MTSSAIPAAALSMHQARQVKRILACSWLPRIQKEKQLQLANKRNADLLTGPGRLS